jgi:hypothetical protein
VSLFQRAADRRKFGVQLGAEAVHNGDDGKRNTSGDQSVFDCRSAGLVSPKLPNQYDHPWTLLPNPQATVNIDR